MEDWTDEKRHFVAVMNVGCLPNQARVEMSSEDQSLCSGVTTKPKLRYPRPDQTKNRIGGKLGILERNHVRVVKERFETTPIAEPFGPKVAKCSIVEHGQAVSEPDEDLQTTDMQAQGDVHHGDEFRRMCVVDLRRFDQQVPYARTGQETLSYVVLYRPQWNHHVLNQHQQQPSERVAVKITDAEEDGRKTPLYPRPPFPHSHPSPSLSQELKYQGASLCQQQHPGQNCPEPPNIVVKLSLLISRGRDCGQVTRRSLLYFARLLLDNDYVHQIAAIFRSASASLASSAENADVFDRIMDLYGHAHGFRDGFELVLQDVMDSSLMVELAERVFHVLT